jgi:hypothetical protein
MRTQDNQQQAPRESAAQLDRRRTALQPVKP